MPEPLFSGTCTALVTPFLGAQINYPMLEQLLNRQLTAGISAVVLCGTTGEASTLSDSEKLSVIRHGAEIFQGRGLIIAGTGSNSTDHAVRLSKAAEAAGADALLVVSPYYNKATDSGLITHYRCIAEAVHIPIILYNIPSRTGLDIPVHVYEALSHIPNIIGVKEACGDITKISRILCQCGPEFTVWLGNDTMALPGIALGAKGVISVASNVFPEEMSALVDAALDGDLDTAASIQTTLMPVFSFLSCEVNPIPVKAAMEHIGYDCGSCRLPLTALSNAHRTQLSSLIQKGRCQI